MVSLATTTASGWVSLGASSSSSRSGYGWSHGTSAKERSHGTRRRLLRSASRQALVAIRYSQARNPAPSKLSRLRQARRKVSWTASSAIPGWSRGGARTGLRVRA
jgi:hypothetical protein